MTVYHAFSFYVVVFSLRLYHVGAPIHIVLVIVSWKTSAVAATTSPCFCVLLCGKCRLLDAQTNVQVRGTITRLTAPCSR